MPTPKKRKLYTFIYTDGVYLSYELTKDDYDNVEDSLVADPTPRRFVSTSVGVIGLDNIRAVIEQKDVEQEVEEEPQNDTLPPLDQESYDWIKQQIGGF